MILKIANLLFILLFSVEGYAQIRHVRGIKSVELFYLHSRFGYGGGFSFVNYYSNSLYGKASAFLEQGTDAGLSYRSVGVDVFIAKTIVHAGHNFYVGGVGGCTFSLDAVTDGGEQFKIDNQFKPGVLAGVEAELYITDKFVLILTWTERFLVGDAFGRNRWLGNAGVRYNL